MERPGLERVVEDHRVNAGLSWLLVGFVLVVAAENLWRGEVLWAGFAGTVAALAVLPAIRLRSPVAMLPWEVLALAAAPLLGRTFATLPVTGRLAQYLSVAALALVVAVELHTFTRVQMTDRFAVLFVVVVTMAAAGVWAVVRWLSDGYLGTTLLLVPGVPEAAVERRLMFEFVWSTLAGALAGVVFELYFRRRRRALRTVPEGDL